MYPGVCKATKKDGTVYYRANITYKGTHISIGSYSAEDECFLAYSEAKKILSDTTITIENFQSLLKYLSFEKIICLLNYRDNNIYIKNPIYLSKNFFLYYLSSNVTLKFDKDDLFYYSSHKIMSRGGHLFVNDYGTQYSLLSRYGIKQYAVKGKDYCFVNNDDTDFRYSNILVINKYHGVSKETKNKKDIFVAKIHLNGDFIVGKYHDEATAAIAYNKAVDVCKSRGLDKNFPQNYVIEYSPKEYADIYTNIKISSEIYKFFRNKNFRK